MTGVSANVYIEGDTTSITSSIGDTIALTARKRLSYGESFMRWEIVYGSGKISNANADSTGFIVTSDSAAIRMKKRTLPIYEVDGTKKFFRYDTSSSKIGSSTSYGVRVFFETHEGGEYAFVYKTSQGFGIIDYYNDSTFKSTTPADTTKRFRTNQDCYSRRCYMKTTPNSKNYVFFYLAGYPNHLMTDSISVWISKTYSIDASSTGSGTILVDSAGKAISFPYRRAIENDSVRIYAVADTDNVFSYWEKVSGSCTIENPKKDTTRVMSIHSDCKVRAVFKAGTIYQITAVPTEYNFTEHSFAKRFSSGYRGVRFQFVAPDDGLYTITVSNDMSGDSLYFLRYSATNYVTLSESKRFVGTVSARYNLTAGQTLPLIVYNYKNRECPFFINYTTAQCTFKLSSDTNGTVIPSAGYDTATVNAKYSIGAKGKKDYRFSNWQIISGAPTIENPKSPYTYVNITGNAEVKANFKPSQIHKISTTKKDFNFLDDYYTESTKSAVRFTWTPPDTATYVLRIILNDSIVGNFNEYWSDSTFKKATTSTKVNASTSFKVKGIPGNPLYWSFEDSTKYIYNKSFSIQITKPKILYVEGTSGGSVNPSGRIYTFPDVETILTAWAQGGYKFDSWTITKGNIDLKTPKEYRTKALQEDSVCSVKANFVVDKSADPYLQVSKFDLNNYPEICMQVSVTDLKNGHSIYGLTAEDFTLTEDGREITPQVTSISAVTGVSVVLVVDQSVSMNGNKRMPKTRDAIRNFISVMGPYDRTAIVGFVGGVKIKDPNAAADSKDSITVDSTIVHRTMTSDIDLLLSVVDSIEAIGKNTNIITGAYVGLQQIINETNPTAVIVFSDGDNNAGSTKITDAINLAKTKKTNIYSIALESETRHPLETLAKNTGGTFSIASDASELSGLYAAIRDNILAQYLVCYQTPDTVKNGQMHTVTISTEFSRTFTSDTIQWDEGATPPSISLTDSTWKLIENTQMPGVPLTISVNINTSIKLQSVNLFLRASGTAYNVFTSYNMTNVRDSVWAFTVPGNLVAKPGIDFYVTAIDSLGQIGKTPRIQTPSMEPYTIFIDNDIPSMNIASVACVDSTSDIKKFSFKLTDSDGIGSATLYYKDSKEVIFQTHPLTYSIENDTWNAEIPAGTYRYKGINYYLRVSDSWGTTVRNPNTGYLVTEPCEVKIVETDSIPEDSLDEPNARDSIKYSLIADTAEIYDKNLDGMADFVRVHFKEEHLDNISSIDSIFWNSNRGEWRYVPDGNIKVDRNDGKWFEAYINRPFKYGLTKAESSRKPFLAFTSVYSDKKENVVLRDKVGAVPLKAIMHHGKVDLEDFMAPSSEAPPDTLIVIMSESIKNTGEDDSWDKIFRYSTSCKDTTTYSLNIKETPSINENGVQWTIILDDFTLKAGYCLRSNPKAKYKDLEGNRLGQGGVTIEGQNSSYYLSEVKPLQSVSGIRKIPDWIPPQGSNWEPLPDSLSAISVKAMAPYKAEIYIFDAIANYVTHFEQKFGYDGEMEEPERTIPEDQSRLGFIYWNQRSKEKRKVGTGVYIWKILFTFDDGYQETVIVKTGIKRHQNKKK